MAQKVRDVMTENPVIMPYETPLAQAATVMRDRAIGDVLVAREAEICGVVTDRDIVVRALAEGKDPASTRIGDICSQSVVTVDADADAEEAVRLMREHAVRRLPVLQSRNVVGIVSIGDLAIERDRESALGDISAAPPSG